MIIKKFRAPALPIPKRDYDQMEQTDLIRTLRLYFNLLDDYLNALTNEVNDFMEPFSATSLDAFGRLRIAQPYTLFDSQNRYQKDPQFSEELVTSGTATYVANESSVDLAVTTASGSKAVRQTFRVFPYQPGKSLMVLATFVMNAGKENLRQRVGYFNTSNGVFFQVNGTTKSFVLRTNTSGTPSDVRTVNQADWNGDKLDGTGESGITLDITKAQILYMDFEWLGVGSVRCGFVINGTFYVCHTFNNANEIDKVYMTTAILPVRYEIENTAATASASTMTQICSSVISEGGYDQKAIPQWARRTTVLTGVGSAAFVPIVSIRLKSTSLGAVVIPSVFHAIPIGSTLDYEVVLIKNPTLTGASFTSNSTNVELDVTATALTGGTIVDLDYVSGSNQGSGVVSEGSDYNFDLQLGVSISGTSDIYTLAARTISGTDDIIGSMSYYDLTD